MENKVIQVKINEERDGVIIAVAYRYLFVVP